MAERLIGTVTHYWGGLGVAGIELSGELGVGDTVRILGNTTDFTQAVGSIQIEHEKVEAAKPGDSVGVKVDEKAREHDQVFLVTSD